jgi:serine/threonine-protein kinase
MGKIYKAEQRPLGRICALKVLAATHEGGGPDPEFHRRFFLEAATVAKLKHPNTVTVFDFGVDEEDGLYFIAMEYLKGRTLSRVLREEGPLDEARVARIGAQIARSLSEAHGHGIVHRDLKPANVLMLDGADEPDTVKVLDFGLAKEVGPGAEELTHTGLFMGSPKYMAPEQILGGEVSGRTDVYTLGVVMYEMLAGKPPFDRPAHAATLIAHCKEPPPPLREARPGIELSHDMEAAVMRCLEKDAAARFASMRDVIAALKRTGGAAWIKDTADSLPAGHALGAMLRSSGAWPAAGGAAELARERADEPTSPRVERPAVLLAPEPLTRLPVEIAPAPPSSPESASQHQEPPSVTRLAFGPPSGPGVAVTSSTAPPRPALPEAGRPASTPRRRLSLALGALALLAVAGAALSIGRRQEAPAGSPAIAPATALPAPPPTATALATTASAAPAPPPVRKVRIESEPAGGAVSEAGVEICPATPCDVYWKDAAVIATHELAVAKRGYRTTKLTVAPGDDHATVSLQPAWGSPKPGGAFKPDPFGGR